ncbi:peptidylprolyl isomerase [Candidatus Methylomirabilis limnetica]|uniref:Peptidyl-prolyl cis-trans isomerase n=2 Tax=Candidatus Methylomirabilis limnetica TaxID=2033718 RepID=A0A2T4U125_9BACT|nr:peptidylprolyl isomerase [Candidatus Methylomirabilis limnetica]
MILALTASLSGCSPGSGSSTVPPETAPVKATKTGDLAIENGSTVKLEYALTDDKGTLLDTNKGKEPLAYTHGQGQIIPGLEKALIGLRTGDAKHVVIRPEEAYGPIRPEAVVEVPKERIPEKLQTVGAHLVAQRKDGQPMQAFVKEVKEKTVVLDTNHPLAGKILTFDVTIVGVEAAQEKK